MTAEICRLKGRERKNMWGENAIIEISSVGVYIGSSSLSSLVGCGNQSIRFLDKMLKYGQGCAVLLGNQGIRNCGPQHDVK